MILIRLSQCTDGLSKPLLERYRCAYKPPPHMSTTEHVRHFAHNPAFPALGVSKPGWRAASSKLSLSTVKPVAAAPWYAVLSASDCSIAPSVSTTTRSLGSVPSASGRVPSPSDADLIESKMRIGGSRPSSCQRSNTAMSQSPYDSANLAGGRGGGVSQLPCGSRKSMRGGSSSASAT